jgi:hypothetical protein
LAVLLGVAVSSITLPSGSPAAPVAFVVIVGCLGLTTKHAPKLLALEATPVTGSAGQLSSPV